MSMTFHAHLVFGVVVPSDTEDEDCAGLPAYLSLTDVSDTRRILSLNRLNRATDDYRSTHLVQPTPQEIAELIRWSTVLGAGNPVPCWHLSVEVY